jgi:hypothetical protein
MRKLLFLIVFFTACVDSSNTNMMDTSSIDSILINSKNNLDTAIIVNTKSDSITKETIVKVVKEIKFLTNEVEKYKEINLLTSQKVATEKIIYRVDTIYIETKKNFWGKEKTSTSVKSDSIINEKIDTTIKSVIDTTLSNN